MRTALVAVLVILIALLWFNPDKPAFRLFVEVHAEEFLLHETGGSALGRALSGAGSGLAGALVERVTERRNYLLFSTYTIDLDGREGDENVWRFVGIAGQFFETHRPETLRE